MSIRCKIGLHRWGGELIKRAGEAVKRSVPAGYPVQYELTPTIHERTCTVCSRVEEGKEKVDGEGVYIAWKQPGR